MESARADWSQARQEEQHMQAKRRPDINGTGEQALKETTAKHPTS
jgi:hypothetical protein